jgi:hypothetical protein
MLAAAFCLLLSACGGGTSFVGTGSGESGVGGTGISLVKGNVADIDGAKPGSPTFENTSVSAGGQRSDLDPDGTFSLREVPAANALVLVFTDNLGNRVSLPLGSFPAGGSATVDDVRIDYDSGTADAVSIEITAPTAAAGAQGSANSNDAGNGCQPQPGEQGCSSSRGNAGGNQGQGNQGQGNQGQGNQGQGNQGQGQGQGQGNNSD